MVTKNADKERTRKRLVSLFNLLDEMAYCGKGLTINEIIDKISLDEEVKHNRKAIYKDIKIFNEFSNQQVIWDKSTNKYNVKKNNSLTREEHEIMINSILAARFISTQQTKLLIDKLSYGESKNLRLEGRVKHDKTNSYDNIKTIFEAINNNKKIRFDYWKPNTDMKLYADKESCIVSPYADVWYKDFYYLIGSFDNKQLSHYRMDRIKNVHITDEDRYSIFKITGKHDEFNISEYVGKHIGGMSTGQIGTVKLKIDKSQIGKLKDEFGDQIEIISKDLEGCTVYIRSMINKDLISWLLGLGQGVEVLLPKSLRATIKEIAYNMSKIYE